MLLQERRWGQGIGEQIIVDNTAYHREKPHFCMRETDYYMWKGKVV